MVKSTQIARIDGRTLCSLPIEIIDPAVGLMLAASVDDEQVHSNLQHTSLCIASSVAYVDGVVGS